MGSGQSISLNEAYELKLTPSLFKLDEDGNEEQDVDITNEHIDKITSYVTSKDFKQDVETVTDISIRPKRENASTVQLKFKQTSAKYISSEGVVVITGKWTSSLKQRKPSVKKSAAASTGNKKSAKQETSHLTMMGSDDEAKPKTEFEQDLEDITVSDVIEKIQENMHHEAYMESKLKGNLFICFKEDIDLKKTSEEE
jgi:hypothetical protein